AQRSARSASSAKVQRPLPSMYATFSARPARRFRSRRSKAALQGRGIRIRGGLTAWFAVARRGIAMNVLRAPSAPRELDGAVGQEVQHAGPAAGDRGMVRAAGPVHQPAGAAPVELRAVFQRHDEIDLAVGMTMVRADHG